MGPSRVLPPTVVAVGLGALVAASIVAAPSAAFAAAPVQPRTTCAQFSGSSLTGFVAAAEKRFPQQECLAPSQQQISVGTSLSVTAPASLDFDGAVLTGTSSLTSSMFVVTPKASSSVLTDVTLSTGPTNGVQCEARCIVTDATVEGFREDGVFLTATSEDSVIGGAASSLAMTTVGDSIGLWAHGTEGLTIGYLVNRYDNHYGALLQQVTGTSSHTCAVTSIRSSDTGNSRSSMNWPANDHGSGLQLEKTSGCVFSSVVATGQGGYGIALGEATNNQFGDVTITGELQGGLNPGINFSHGASNNTFTKATIDHETIAVEIGNNGSSGGGSKSGNDNGNVFDSLTAADNGYGVIDIEGGSGNSFDKVVGDDNGAHKPFYAALLMFNAGSSATTDNTVKAADFTGASSVTHDTAEYDVYADSASSGNSVTLTATDPATYQDAACEDLSGSNTFSGCSAGS